MHKTNIHSGFSFILVLIALFAFQFPLHCQTEAVTGGYHFTNDIFLPASSIKNQAFTNTCFVFSVVSFIESELLKKTNSAPDISEMYLVRSIYIEKAKKFMRLHGNMYFTGGGELNDVLDVLPEYGMLPRTLYGGLLKGQTFYDHQQLEDSLRTYLNDLAINSKNTLKPDWLDGYTAILDKYLGKLPDSLDVAKGSTYPLNFFKSLQFDRNDYILLTSFTHHSFFKGFSLELPDNWSWAEAWNIPLDDFLSICYGAIRAGYSVAWDADDSEKGFSWKNGIAVIPDETNPGNELTSKKDWGSLPAQQKRSMVYSFNVPVNELKVTPLKRQQEFDNYATTDDHCMHIVGIAHDSKNNPFLIVKNSWGTRGAKYEGYLYVSESYFLLKSIAILVNKKALPPAILKKLG